MRARYTTLMSVRAAMYLLVACVVFFGAGYFGYDLYMRYIVFGQSMQDDAARAAEVADNRARMLQALTAAGIPAQQVTRGFWYTVTDRFGNESIAYFDSDAWALQKELSDEQIAGLAVSMKNTSITDRALMRDVPEEELPSTLQFHNELYGIRAPGEYQATEAQLAKKFASGKATSDELWALSYMYELNGQYEKRDEVNAVNCTTYKARCAGDIPVLVHGRVIDLQKRPIPGASVRVLSHPEITAATTDTKGEFTIKVSVRVMEKIRLSAVKRNFSEGVASLIVVGAGKKDYDAEDIALGSPIDIITIDTQKRTVSDPNSEAHQDGSFALRTSRSVYEIPAGAIVRANGSSYRGVVDVYLYEFEKGDVPENLMTIDTFDQVVGYAGDLMKSFGMPYIQFFTPSGEELHVQKSKPMVLTYKIANMAELRAGSDKIYAPLTEADMQLLVSASQGMRYPIDRTFLINNDLLRFPAFWVFDRKRGVWENIGISVLDTTGTIRTIFYTLNDTL